MGDTGRYNDDGDLKEEILADTRLSGHFVLKSGRHADTYFNKDRIFSWPGLVIKVATALYKLAQANGGADCPVVCGPAVGGAILAQYVANGLSRKGWPVRAVFADKVGTGFKLARGYDLIVSGLDVLLVEDVLTTGGSVRAVAQAVTWAGGRVKGVVAIINRGGVTSEELGVPLLGTLVDVNVSTWSAEECPLCKNGQQIDTGVGHGSAAAAIKEGGAA
jgi:orotate phosphoribosyltransferase